MLSNIKSILTSFLLVSSLYCQASTDIAVYYLLTPTNCAKHDQTVQFYPMNVGNNTIDSFEARVYKNDELQFVEQVNQSISPNNYIHVTLENTLHFEYEESALVSLQLLAPGDTNHDNDSVLLSIDMPKQMPYPYTWSAENSRVNWHNSGLDYLDWQYDEGFDAYYMSDRGTNWMGTLISDALEFPVGEPVKCSFEYGTSGGDVTLYFLQDYGDNVTVTDTVMVGQSTQDFSSSYFSFIAQGPAMIRITATLGGEWNASGSIYLRNICFSRAGKDLKVNTILQPVGEAQAISEQPIQVKARFYNPSPIAIDNPCFCYDAGWGTVKETYQGTVAPGKSIDYAFAQTYTCSTVCSKELQVWCEAEGDTDDSNDRISKMVAYYEPEEFPYEHDFDGFTDYWTIVDLNDDGQTFSFEPMANNDVAAVFENYSANDINELLISPAIKIPAGQHRVDFNFACYLQKGDVNLKLYYGTTPDVNAMTELLFDRDLRNQTWLTGYHLLTIDQEDVYYFAFLAKGKNDAVIIDNFKVDDGEDIGLTDIRFNTESGYNLSTSSVSISYANFGVTPQENISLGYQLINGEVIEETNPAVVSPGDTITYTFDTPADISETGCSYQLIGYLLSHGGDEDINDILLSFPITNNQPVQLPYHYDFNEEERNSQWLLTSVHEDEYSGWKTDYSYTSYRPLGMLKHETWSLLPSDDWAYSEGIEMKKGTYEVSYFHHERTFFSDPIYEQDFELRMGEERTPEGMNILVDKQEKVDVYLDPFEKIIKVVEIPEDGVYFLGFHNYSTTTQGMTYIDEISIEEVKEGFSLPYQSDFAGADTLNWTLYDINQYTFDQWENYKDMYVVERTEDDMWVLPEGLLVSPKLHLEPNKKVAITIDYSVETTDDNLTLQLYTGNVNDNSELKPVALLPQYETLYTYEFQTSDQAEDLFVGLRSNTPMDGNFDYYYLPNYTFCIASVKVEYVDDAGISQLSDDREVEVYDLAGRLIKRGSMPPSDKGLYIIKQGNTSKISNLE